MAPRSAAPAAKGVTSFEAVRLQICRVALRLAVVLTIVCASVVGAQPIVIELVPVVQDASVGALVGVELRISGLGDFVAPSLSTFDIDVLFDPTILGFETATFGDPALSDQLDLFGLGSVTTATPDPAGSLNLFELSFDSPAELESLQAGAFVLATITVRALAVGTSELDLFLNSLGDASGQPLAADVLGASVVVTAAAAVPQPATLLLLSGGLVGAAAWIGFTVRSHRQRRMMRPPD